MCVCVTKGKVHPHGCKCPVTAPMLTAPMSSDGDTLTVSMCSENKSPPFSSTLSSERELTESTSSGGLPTRKKRKTKVVQEAEASWKLPQFITASTKGDRFVHCKLCRSHFSVAHGGFNDVTRHVQGFTHFQRLKDAQSTSAIASALSRSQAEADIAPTVISAEIMMSQFIAMHNLSFQTTEHLTDLIPAMFPDSKIAAKFSCKHTKTKSIICDAIDPHLKKPVVDRAKISSFSLL